MTNNYYWSFSIFQTIIGFSIFQTIIGHFSICTDPAAENRRNLCVKAHVTVISVIQVFNEIQATCIDITGCHMVSPII